MANNDNNDAGFVVVAAAVVTTAIAIKETAQVLSPIVQPIIKDGSAAINRKLTELKEKIELPEIPDHNSYTMLDDAKTWITNRGLPVSEAVVKANILYKDCLEFEVVGMDHKPKQKVAPGTPIVLYYVTAEIIEKSKQLYVEAEREKFETEQKKAELLANKARKKLEKEENTKQMLGNFLTSINHRLNDAATNTREHIIKIIPSHNKQDNT